MAVSSSSPRTRLSLLRLNSRFAAEDHLFSFRCSAVKKRDKRRSPGGTANGRTPRMLSHSPVMVYCLWNISRQRSPYRCERGAARFCGLPGRPVCLWVLRSLPTAATGKHAPNYSEQRANNRLQSHPRLSVIIGDLETEPVVLTTRVRNEVELSCAAGMSRSIMLLVVSEAELRKRNSLSRRIRPRHNEHFVGRRSLCQIICRDRTK
ncbi:hypothetical protein TNCV_2308441 [Trichonephila clavipes]|nr:hypothetical protein TNCV_2308441 [Trichonephila clavipes]